MQKAILLWEGLAPCCSLFFLSVGVQCAGGPPSGNDVLRKTISGTVVGHSSVGERVSFITQSHIVPPTSVLFPAPLSQCPHTVPFPFSSPVVTILLKTSAQFCCLRASVAACSVSASCVWPAPSSLRLAQCSPASCPWWSLGNHEQGEKGRDLHTTLPYIWVRELGQGECLFLLFLLCWRGGLCPPYAGKSVLPPRPAAREDGKVSD